jgi:hypothetical protein
VIAGDEGKRDSWRANVEANQAAPAAAAADRAGYYAGAGGRRDDGDVVGAAMGSGSAAGAVAHVAPEALPAELRGMDKAQLTQEIEKRVTVRKEAQKQLEQLNNERNDYLAKQGAKGDGFDAKVKATVDHQLNMK